MNQSVSLSLSVCPSVCLSLSVSVCPSVCLSLSLCVASLSPTYVLYQPTRDVGQAVGGRQRDEMDGWSDRCTNNWFLCVLSTVTTLCVISKEMRWGAMLTLSLPCLPRRRCGNDQSKCQIWNHYGCFLHVHEHVNKILSKRSVLRADLL